MDYTPVQILLVPEHRLKHRQVVQMVRSALKTEKKELIISRRLKLLKVICLVLPLSKWN